jgi:Arc/MetJ family transcription regulator
MLTNIDLDEPLVTRAMQLTGINTKKGVVTEALRALVQLYEQGEVRNLRGKLHRDAEPPRVRRG